MDKDPDPFAPENLCVTPEMVAEHNARVAQARTTKRSQKNKPDYFVMLPYNEQVLTATGRRDASGAVLMELAYQAFKTHTNKVVLANETLGGAKVSRYAKARALRRLEAAGLILVDWRGAGQSPLVTLLWIA